MPKKSNSSLGGDKIRAIRRLMQPGVEAYKQQAMDKKVLIESAVRLMGDNPVYALPRKPSDDENTYLVEGAYHPCIIATRACTEEGRQYFPTREAKIEIINYMQNHMLADDIDIVACDIRIAFGEINQQQYDVLTRKKLLDENGDFSEEQNSGIVDEAEEVMNVADDGYESVDVNFDSRDAVPATDAYNDKPDEVHHEPSVAEAEGNSEPRSL